MAPLLKLFLIQQLNGSLQALALLATVYLGDSVAILTDAGFGALMNSSTLEISQIRDFPVDFPPGTVYSFVTPQDNPSSIFAIQFAEADNTSHSHEYWFCEFDARNLSLLQRRYWFAAEAGSRQPVLMFSAITNSSFFLLLDNGTLVAATLPDGIITDVIQIPSPSYGTPFVGAVHAANGAIYLASTNRLSLLFENCPLGQYRSLRTGLCSECPQGSIVSIVC